MDIFIVFVAIIILFIYRKKIRKEADIELLERESNRCKMDIRLRHQEIFEEENKKEIIEFEIDDLKTIYDLLASLSDINLESLNLIKKCLQNNFGVKGDEMRRKETSYQFFRMRKNRKKKRI